MKCFGSSNGAIDVTPSGGTPNYSYQWSGSSSATTQNINNISAGSYNLTITDNNGCTFNLPTVVISQPATSLTANESNNNIVCNGGNTGTITVTTLGGTSPYTYLWNDNATTQNRSGLPVGSYSVVITDANNCTFSINNISLGQPGSLNVTEAHTNISCNGLTNGSINI